MASKCSRLDFHKLQHPDDEHVLTDDRYNQFVTSISSGMTLKSFARTAFNFECLSLEENPICGSIFNCFSLTMSASKLITNAYVCVTSAGGDQALIQSLRISTLLLMSSIVLLGKARTISWA